MVYKWYSDGILSGQAGFESRVGLWLFLSRIAVNLFSLGVRLCLMMCNGTEHTLPASFLFLIIIYHCEDYQFQAIHVLRKKEKLIQKEAGKGPYLKKNLFI